MSPSSTAYLAFGWVIDQDEDLPWGDDIEEWWLKLQGFEEPEGVYDRDGMKLPGATEFQENEYWRARNEFIERHPIPVEIEFGGHFDSSEQPVIIRPIGNQFLIWTSSYDPKPVGFSELWELGPLGQVAEAMRFIEEHKIPVTAEDAGWLLYASYG